MVLLSCNREKAYEAPQGTLPEPSRTYAPMAEAPIARPPASPAPKRTASGASAEKPEAGTSAAAGSSSDAGPALALKLGTGAGCPEGMARTGSFCIDRFEIALEGKDGTRFRHNVHPPEGMDGLSAISIPEVSPQGHLSQPQAMKACQNAGKRLCTSDEWEAACKGKAGNPFPYGAAMDASACNVDKRSPHILDYYFPGTPHLKRTGKEFNDPMLLLDPAYQTKAGRMPLCVTPEGVYDMDGNMSEWVSDSESRGGVTYGTFRGAPFSGYAKEGCARKTTAHDARYYDYSTGARCCADMRGRGL